MLTRSFDPAYDAGYPLPVANAHQTSHWHRPGLVQAGAPVVLLPDVQVMCDPSDRLTWTPGRELVFTDRMSRGDGLGVWFA